MENNTRNLGQVSGVFIGNTPPENTNLIWYDNTPSQMRHKIYDFNLKKWIVLDQNVITSITYSELVNTAMNVGLSVGQYFQISDKGNVLALAVTSTKVQYVDAAGNILIDDLGTNIQYHVTSSNLMIDDVNGVFDTDNKTLVFQFLPEVPDFENGYILGKDKKNNVWRLVKYSIWTFLSKTTNNSITWKGGFFFDFLSSLKNQFDKKGGIVSKDAYDIDMQVVNKNIENVGKENQQIISNANKAIAAETADAKIYNKAIPTAPSVILEDVKQGDRLFTIVSKFQTYINKFKTADGIQLPSYFYDVDSIQYIDGTDSVYNAFRKVNYFMKQFAVKIGITLVKYNLPDDLSQNWELEDGDTISRLFGKIQTKFYQIGLITNDTIESKKRYVSNIDSNITYPFLKLDFGTNWMGVIELIRNTRQKLQITPFQIQAKTIKINSNDTEDELFTLGTLYNYFSSTKSYTFGSGYKYGTFILGKDTNSNAAFSAFQQYKTKEQYDAWFTKLKVFSCSFGIVNNAGNEKSILLQPGSVIVGSPVTTAEERRTFYLPNNPPDNTFCIIFNTSLNASVIYVEDNSKDKIMTYYESGTSGVKSFTYANYVTFGELKKDAACLYGVFLYYTTLIKYGDSTGTWFVMPSIRP